MNISEDLLVRYLQGEYTSEELATVKAWESQSDDNKKILEQLYFILQASERLQKMNAASPEAALLNLKKKISSRRYSSFFHQSLMVTQRIAAVLFIPIFILAGYLILQDYSNTQRYVEVKTNSGMISSFDLPDGSKVWLNSGGKLKYPAEFSSKKREVHLEGQGYFSVKRDEDAPFMVRIDDFYSVEVLGTEFNITAYEDDHLIETTLVTGKVKLNIHLKVLSRYYNVRFAVKNPKIMQSEITAKFTNEPLQQVLGYLELASGIKFKIKHPDKIENDTLSTSVIEVYK